MTSSIGIVGSGAGAAAQAVVPPSPADSALAVDTAPSYIKTAVGSLQNPRVTLDPSAGFITQYLNADGSQVVSQTPNAVTVAYLRLGLTASGLTKQAAYPAHVGGHVGTTA